MSCSSFYLQCVPNFSKWHDQINGGETGADLHACDLSIVALFSAQLDVESTASTRPSPQTSAMSPASRILLSVNNNPCIICLNGTSKGILDENTTDDEYYTYEINGFHCTDAITAAVDIESGTESCSFFTEAFKSSCCDHSSTTGTTLSTTLDTTQAITSADVG